jgi:hypothetical protein
LREQEPKRACAVRVIRRAAEPASIRAMYGDDEEAREAARKAVLLREKKSLVHEFRVEIYFSDTYSRVRL